MGFEPGGLGGHHVVGGDYAFLEAEGGGAQVVLGLGQVGLGGGVGLDRFLSLIRGLADLQLYHFAGILHLQFHDGLLRAGCAIFVVVAAPVPDGDFHHHAHREGAAEAGLEAVEHVGVAERVGSDQRHIGEHGAQRHTLLHPRGVGGKLQGVEVGTVGVHLLHVVAAGYLGLRIDALGAFVGYLHLRVDGQTAELGQRHAAQAQSVLHLQEVYIGFVELHIHAQLVALGGYTLLHHLLHVAVERIEQIHKTFGQFMLGLERHHCPVGGIHGVDHILALAALQLRLCLLVDGGQLVERHYLAAHVDRLCEGHGSEKYIVDVKFHRLLRYQRRLRRDGSAVGQRQGHYHRLAVGTDYRFAVGSDCRKCGLSVLVALCQRVESAHRQVLVAVKHRELLLVVGVAARKVDPRQICRERLLAGITGLTHLFRLDHQLLIVGQCQCTARIKRIHLPRRRCLSIALR